MFVIQENKSMQTIISWKWIFDLFIVFKQRTYISRFGINLVKLTKTKQFTGDTHMTSTLRRGGGGGKGGGGIKGKKRCFRGGGGGGGGGDDKVKSEMLLDVRDG